jgi:spore coat polysaccharide biosynthesis predicted glycosyltransferase SpsG
VPSIVIVTAPNQRLLAERMAAKGAALVLGWHADIGAQGIAAAFDRLAENAPLRARMAESGAAMCDGLGAQRSAHAIAALAERLPA